VLNTMCF